MTAPATPNDTPNRQRRRRRWLALVAVVAVIIVAALLTPELTGGRSGDPRLTTYSTGPLGARLFYEMAHRLGWRVERRTNDSTEMDARTTLALLDPPQHLTALETHRVLNRVRAGSALLYVMSGGSPMDDSLHVKRTLLGGTYVATSAGTRDATPVARAADTLRARRFDTAAVDTVDDEDRASVECVGKPTAGGALPLWGDEAVHLWQFSWTRARPADAVIFARAAAEGNRRDSSAVPQPAAAGFNFGRGRVVILSDPDLLRNDVLRVCHWGLDVVAVRMLEYLAQGGQQRRDLLVFDEYHQGFGAHPGTLRAIAAYLARASSGHVLLQCLLGGLALLLALGPRPVPAHDAERIERRSPLEHVSALAHAYERVGATRIVTARLLHGVRRRLNSRLQLGRTTEESDTSFLDRAVEIAPALDEDVALVRRALTTTITPRELVTVGVALQRIEQSLQAQRR